MEVCGKNTKREKPIVRISNNYHFLIINVCQVQFNFTNPRFLLADSPSSVQRSVLAYLDYRLVVREHLPQVSLGPCSAEATYLYHSASHSEEKAHARNEQYIRTSGQDLTTDKNPA